MMSVVRFAFVFAIIHKNVESELKSLRSIRNLAVQLRNDSDSMTEYVAKIQAIFCPEQPFCGELTSDSKQNMIRSLPETVTVENETVMTGELRSYVGLCCYPCSCDDTCKYDNNCCLTKAVENKTFNDKLTSSISSECIAPTSKSFKNMQGIGPGYSKYFMTTQCFSDTNSSVQSKCETPNPYDVTETIPVTSLRSGRTYWNQHCAVCNNDSETIVFWNMRVIFLTHFVFYKSASGTYVFPDTMEEFYNRVLATEEIHYIPPFDMQQKRCAPQHVQRTCRTSRNDTREADHQFLYEACNLFTSPITFSVMSFSISKNIFCFICNEESVTTLKHECSFSDELKYSQKAMTALINYNDKTESSTATESSTYVNSHENGNCSCKEIYDTYQEKCRPVYCPPGSLFIGCSCTKIMATVSGMHVLLKLKVTAEQGSLYPSTDELAAKFRKALRKAMEKSIGHVSVKIHASFRPRNGTNSYFLYVATVRSDGGYDTKETLKPLLDYLYADEFLRVRSNGNMYSVGLVREISFNSINDRLVSAFDTKNRLEFDLEFSVEDSFTKRVLYQELSPLLFCKQVQLDESEFTERDGQIIINASSTVVSLSDFYLTAELQARLCVDEYLSSPFLSFGNTNDPVTISPMVICFCILLALWKTKN